MPLVNLRIKNAAGNIVAGPAAVSVDAGDSIEAPMALQGINLLATDGPYTVELLRTGGASTGVLSDIAVQVVAEPC